MGIFDGLPTAVADKPYLKEDLSRVDESWAAARFDSLPHVVHILTSKDREVEARYLKEQSEIIEDAVDEVVHAYHTGFNKAIQNYSQILRLFSESAESIATLKVELADAKKKLLGSCNKQLHQLWYRSVTLRHIISLLDQIEGISKITHREEEIAPFVAEVKRNYIFGGICSSAANASIKALADMKSINLFGVQQICRNSIALEQALAAIPSIDSESIQLRLDRVRTYYELLNMPFEALLAFITEHEHLFTAAEYSNLIKVKVPGKEIPADAEERFSEILSH